MDLFQDTDNFPYIPPLAERMRPKELEYFVGQRHLLGPDGILRDLFLGGIIPSMIYWGEPGSGKTTLARLIARRGDVEMKELSAVDSGVRELRALIDYSRKRLRSDSKRVIVFIDEIHRYSKSQQDALLRAVEEGIIILIGATTENPSFEVIPPLLSRARVLRFEALSGEELEIILRRAVTQDRLMAERAVSLTPQAEETLIGHCGGDARILLNALEIAVELSRPADEEAWIVEETAAFQALQKKTVYHDKKGDYHYDLASAFIKSMRASDPDAALFYMARMLAGGEDPKFIARRMVILASEDIGNANPNALLLATSCFQAVTMIGMPEARIILGQTCAYLASSPKSNASYRAIDAALEDAEKHPDIPVPLKLRNPVTSHMKAWEYGKDYQYPHSFPGHFIENGCLPEELKDRIYYDPTDIGAEKQIKDRLDKWWSKRRK